MEECAPQGLLPALALLAVAYTNQSLIGFLFLLAFGVWGYLIPHAVAAAQRGSLGRGGAISRALWGTVSGRRGRPLGSVGGGTGSVVVWTVGIALLLA